MQLPVGDKPCLADPVDSPESLGTRSAAVLIDVCTCGNIASYSNSKKKKLCCSHKWIGEIWFQGNLNYCTQGGGRIWWGARRENTDAPHVLGFRGTRTVILSGVLDSSQFAGVYLWLRKKYMPCTITRVWILLVQGVRAVLRLRTCRTDEKASGTIQLLLLQMTQLLSNTFAN